MTKIEIYDTEAKTIEKVCENNDMTPAEIIEILCEYLEDAMMEYDLIYK